MPVETDYLKYHQSISKELKATQDRIRNLIGSKHWLTDGEHKEAVLRKVLRSQLPEEYNVGKGFICFENSSSTQIDVLITNKKKPTLFKDGELFILTPDCVQAILEVKTSQNNAELRDTLNKLSNQIQAIRETGNPCWAGLFIFDESCTHENALYALFDAANCNENRVINFVALGPKDFFRFWLNGNRQANGYFEGPVWHSYNFTDRTMHGLSHAYFISNIVMNLSEGSYPHSAYAWFPIKGDGGKERYRQQFISLHDREVIEF